MGGGGDCNLGVGGCRDCIDLIFELKINRVPPTVDGPVLLFPLPLHQWDMSCLTVQAYQLPQAQRQ